jgi:hypothetical protein
MRKPYGNIYDFLLLNDVLNTPQLNNLCINNWGLDLNNIYEHCDSYLLNIQIANSSGPIEKHPYLDLYQNDCNFQREMLLLGTFPPSSYLNNLPLNNLFNPNIQPNNPTHYYYGNINDLWDYLFALNGQDLTIPNIQAHLSSNKLSISDVFAYVQRKNMISAFDSEYRNILPNRNIVKIFDTDSKIHTVLLTSGNLTSFRNDTTSTLTGFMWILEDCGGGLKNFKISGDKLGNGPFYPINTEGVQSAINQQDVGVIWWIKTETKKIRIINLPSPAPSAARQMKNTDFFKKWVNYKAVSNEIPLLAPGANMNNYLNLHNGIFNAPYTKQYRREVYQMVLNNTIHLI